MVVTYFLKVEIQNRHSGQGNDLEIRGAREKVESVTLRTRENCFCKVTHSENIIRQ